MAFQPAGAQHTASRNNCGTLVKPCGAFRISPHRSSWKSGASWWNPGTIPSWNLTLQLVEPWSNPGGTLVERWWTLNATLAEPGGTGGTLVKRLWNLTSNHPGPPRSPRRTWWNPGGTVVEPWWNPRGTLPQGHTPEPIWAETPKLSAVGEKSSPPQEIDCTGLGIWYLKINGVLQWLPQNSQ